MRVTLIPVPSLDEEAAIVRSLPYWRKHFAGHVAPVIDKSGLVERVERTLRTYGLDVETSPAPSRGSCFAPAEPDMFCLASAEPNKLGPGLLVVSPGVDPTVERLAAALSGVAPQHLPADREQIARLLPCDRYSCLLIMNPDATPPGQLLDLAANLGALEIPWGLLYAIDAIEARFSILKSLLIQTVPTKGTFQFISSAYTPPRSERRSLVLGAQTMGFGYRDQIMNPHDVLLMNGHANLIDASISSDMILCAREGHAGTGADSNLAPCFNGGSCYRQPSSGPQRQLIGVDRIRAKILVLSGCSVLPLGKGWCRTTASIAYQTTQTDILGLITASAIISSGFELDLLCLGLIADGLPLGNVVAEINRLYRDELGQPTGLPPGVGPFVFVGNPALHLLPFPTVAEASKVEVINGETPSCRISWEESVLGTPGVLLRARMVPRATTPYLLGETARKSSYRGIWHNGKGESRLFLLFDSQYKQDRKGTFELTIEMPAEDELLPIKQMLSQYWSSMLFWTMFLSSYGRELSTCKAAFQNLRAVLNDLPRYICSLSAFFSKIQMIAGVVIERRTILESVHLLWDVTDTWARKVLATVIDIACETGYMSSWGNPPFYHLSELITEPESCPCGGVIMGQVFRTPDGLHKRVLRQCPVCVSTRDEDGRGMLRLTSHPREVMAGSVLSYECGLSAPPEAYLNAHLVLVLKTWSRGQRVTSPVHHQILAPGAKTSVTLMLDVPPELISGVYPVMVLGVLNGTLYILRRSMPFAAAS